MASAEWRTELFDPGDREFQIDPYPTYARLREEAGGDFPEKVTAFREDMAVHGRYGKPCPDCQAPVQRVVRAKNEFNYCARCQTEGRVFADRSLSKLLGKDWPRTLEEFEEMGLGPKTGT